MWLKNGLRDDNIMMGCNGHSRALLDNAFWAIWTTSGYLLALSTKFKRRKDARGLIYEIHFFKSEEKKENCRGGLKKSVAQN